MWTFPLRPRAGLPSCTLQIAARACAVLLLLAIVQAQTSPAAGPLPSQPVTQADDIPLADYLGLLQQISPAAEEGARTYLAAIRLRCGRDMTTAQLRHAITHGGGDPNLMGLIRAAHQKDRGARQQLVAQIPCPQGGER